MGRPKLPPKPCAIDGCQRPSHARTWCSTHYKRWREHGTVELPQISLIDRIMSRVNKAGPVPESRPDLGPCWIFTGCLLKGYGQIHARALGGTKLVHRVVFELLVGPIPDGLELDHLCRTPACCNPAHLEPVTHAENVNRGVGLVNLIASRQGLTHCPQGHEFTPDNTYVNPTTGFRRCRTCNRDWVHATKPWQRRAAA